MRRAAILGTFAAVAWTLALPAARAGDDEVKPRPHAPETAPSTVPAAPTETAPAIVPTISPPIAAPPPPPPMRIPELPDERPRTRWYGWQILMSDGLTTGLLIAAAQGGSRSDRDTMAQLAGALYFIGPAVVHFAHGNIGRGFASPAIRFGAPVVSAGIGCALAGGGGDWGCIGGLVLGALVGIGGAIAIDVAALAHEPAPAPTGVSFAPRASVTKEGISLGLAAAF